MAGEKVIRWAVRRGKLNLLILRNNLVGVAGFEPATPSSRTKCATKLHHTPINGRYYTDWLVIYQPPYDFHCPLAVGNTEISATRRNRFLSRLSMARRLLRTASSSAITMTSSKKLSTGSRRVARELRAVA